MIRHPLVLSPDDNLHKAATLMASRNIRRLPVVEGGQAGRHRVARRLRLIGLPPPFQRKVLITALGTPA